jgi:hypothetical protein
MGKKTNENKRMSSIARRINMSFWLKELGNVILIDIVIAFLIVSVFAVWGRKQLPQGVGGMRYYVEKNEDGGAYEYIIEGSDEKKYRYDVKILWDIIELPGIILLDHRNRRPELVGSIRHESHLTFLIFLHISEQIVERDLYALEILVSGVYNLLVIIRRQVRYGFLQIVYLIVIHRLFAELFRRNCQIVQRL